MSDGLFEALVFDSAYYAGLLKLPGNAWQHYSSQGLSGCAAPNEYFAQHKDALYVNGRCVVGTWAADLSNGVEALTAYVTSAYSSNQTRGAIVGKFKDAARKIPCALEGLLSEDFTLVDTLIIRSLSQARHRINEETALYLEHHLDTSQTPRPMLDMLAHYVGFVDASDPHGSFITAVLPHYWHCADVIGAWLSDGAQHGRHFSHQTFDEVVKALSERERESGLVEFVALGLKHELYYSDVGCRVVASARIATELLSDALISCLKTALSTGALTSQMIGLVIERRDDISGSSVEMTMQLIFASCHNRFDKDLCVLGVFRLLEAGFSAHGELAHEYTTDLLAFVRRIGRKPLRHNIVSILTRVNTDRLAYNNSSSLHLHAYVHDYAVTPLPDYGSLSEFYEWLRHQLMQARTSLYLLYLQCCTSHRALFILHKPSGEEVKALRLSLQLMQFSPRTSLSRGDDFSSFVTKVDDLELFSGKLRARLLAYGARAMEIGWGSIDLENLLPAVDPHSRHDFVSALEIVADYKIPLRWFDANGNTALDVLHQLPHQSWIEALRKLYRHHQDYSFKNGIDLFSELKDLNSSPRVLADAQQLSEQLHAITRWERRAGIALRKHIVISTFFQKPVTCRSGELHVYHRGGHAFYLAQSRLGVIEEKKFSSNLAAQLLPVLLNSQPLSKSNIDGIYSESGYKPHWTWDQFQQWRASVTTITQENLAEVVAVLKYAYHLTVFTSVRHLRDHQVIAILLMCASQSGRLLEIETGGGKSAIVAIFNAIKAISGLKIYAVTSSATLAQRDAEEQREFYELLGISVAHNVVVQEYGKPKQCYRSAVVYCEISHLIGDHLRNLHMPTLMGRPASVIVIDEVDNLILDQAMMNAMKVLLPVAIPGFSELKAALVLMWGQLRLVRTILEHDPVTDSYCIAGLQQDVDGLFSALEGAWEWVTGSDPTRKCVKLKDPHQFITSLLESHIQEFLDDPVRENRHVIVPRHLERFVKDHVARWADSVITASQYTENSQYLVHRAKSANRSSTIAPIDYLNTGDIQLSLRWSNGLHQFLQIKHSIHLFSEGLVSTYISYIGFFLRYRGALFGVSGTLGGAHHKEFFASVYGVDSVVLPAFTHKKLVTLPPLITHEELFATESWVDGIVSDAINQSSTHKRATLVILPTINLVRMVASALAQGSYPRAQIYRYEDPERQEDVVERTLRPGDILVATNAAGRGTDLKITRALEKNGGLHVIEASFAASKRVSLQAIGRAARQGMMGSTRLHIIAPQDCGIACLNDERDAQERKELEIARKCKLPGMLLEDELFNDLLVKFIRDLDSPTGYEIVIGQPPNTRAQNALYVFERSGSLMMLCNDRGEIEIDGQLKELSVNSHAVLLLATRGKAQALAKQDYELIHFISANTACRSDQSQQVMSRVALRRSSGSNTATDALTAYQLWQEDRDLYNNKYEIDQVREEFSMWLVEQRPHLTSDDKCMETGVDETFAEKRAMVLDSFDRFKRQILERQKAGLLITNPAHLLMQAYALERISWDQANFTIVDNVQNPLDRAVEVIANATKLDDLYSWPSHNAMSYMRLKRDGNGITGITQANEAAEVMQQFIEDAQMAREKIITFVLPRVESQFGYLKAHGLNDTSELALQHAAALELYRSIEKRILTNVETAIKGLKSLNDRPQMLRLKRFLTLEDLTNAVNVTAISDAQGVPAAQINVTVHIYPTLHDITESGAFIYEVELFELEDDRSWLDTLFIGLLGIAQILIGMAMIPIGGPFMTALGTAFVSQGIGDMLSSFIAIANDTPLTFDAYLKSKAVSMTVSLIVAGIAHIAGKLNVLDVNGKAQSTLKSFKESQSLFLAKQTVYTVAGRLAGEAIARVGNKIVDKNDGPLERSMHGKTERLISSSPQIKVLLAWDAVHGTKYANELIQEANQITASYSTRFRTYKAEVAKGVGAGVVGMALGGFGPAGQAIASGVNTAVNVGLGVIKADEAFDDFESKFKEKVRVKMQKAGGAKEMMQRKLQDGAAILRDLEGKGFIVTDSMTRETCAKIPMQMRYAQSIRSVCEQVASAINAETPETRAALANLKQTLADNLFQSLKRTIKSDIAQPIASAITNAGLEKMEPLVDSHLKKIFSQMKDGAHTEQFVQADLRGAKKRESVRQTKRHTAPDKQSTTQKALEDALTRHKIKHGDTLSAIARRHGVTQEQLLAANPQVTDPNKIYAGQTLKIPVSTSVETVIIVKPGDTLSGIAKARGTTVAALMKANPHIKDANKIFAGDELVVPATIMEDGHKAMRPGVEAQGQAAQVHTQTHAQTKESAQKPTSLAHDKVKGRALMAACDAVFAKTVEKFRDSLSALNSDATVQILDTSHLNVDRIGSALVRLKFDDGTSYDVYLIAGVEHLASGRAETAFDLLDYAKMLHANRAQEALADGLRNVGETLDDLSGGDITSDPDYIAFDKSATIDYAFKTRPQVHIERIKQLQTKYGFKDKPHLPHHQWKITF